MRRLLARLWPFGRSDSEDDGDGGSVWDAIPAWQYEGRLSESGGIARGEQERAIAGIQRRADAIERNEDRAEE